jgi:hypothetical protein
MLRPGRLEPVAALFEAARTGSADFAARLMLANALKGRGYDFRFRFGDGGHSASQAALDLPESLAWLWRGYDPDRTEEEFTQDPSEREQPPFRVRVTNREC